MQKLLDLVNVKLEDTTFLEAIKCFPLNRKSLNNCSKHCKPFLYKQLEILNPNIIILLGDTATRLFSQEKYNNFNEVVGKVYEVNINGKIMKVIPIYHPSPISPKSYEGNIEIFEMLKVQL